jgi:glycerate 2-kinase
MHALIAPDKFKGSLTAAQVATALAEGIGQQWRTTQLPVADGGDGTVDAAVTVGWQPVHVPTTGPTGHPITATYAVRATAAVIELAAAVGLTALPDGRPDPLGASTFGLGTVIAHALDHGVDDIVIGIGGSASTDGGAGLLHALGARILDDRGNELPSGGAALVRAARLDLDALLPAARTARFQVACDVDNPLLGPRGATAIYAPQKGAGSADLVVLEAAMARWGEVVRDAVGRDLVDTPGAGAAGGTGFGLMAVLGARPRPGIDLVLHFVGFETHLADADLVITGEGRLDEQTLHGKAPAGVASAAARRGIPVVAVAGSSLLDTERLHRAGFKAAYTLADIEPDPRVCMAEAAALLRQLGRRIAEEQGVPS